VFVFVAVGGWGGARIARVSARVLPLCTGRPTCVGVLVRFLLLVALFVVLHVLFLG
jgi:hypothetical protein